MSANPKCDKCNDSGWTLVWGPGGSRFSGLYSLTVDKERCVCRQDKEVSNAWGKETIQE